MPAATTIVVAREDFSIPGGDDGEPDTPREPGALENRFFNLLREAKPDVVVLDLSRANGTGVDMILKIRRQSTVPILVVCPLDGKSVQDYLIAGAAECIGSPVDVVTLNEVLQLIHTFKGMMSIHEASLGTDGEPEEPEEIDLDKLGELAALQGVVKFPVRIKCATLSWNALAQGLDEVAAVS